LGDSRRGKLSIMTLLNLAKIQNRDETRKTRIHLQNKLDLAREKGRIRYTQLLEICSSKFNRPIKSIADLKVSELRMMELNLRKGKLN
jgi:hypothetical protein